MLYPHLRCWYWRALACFGRSNRSLLQAAQAAFGAAGCPGGSLGGAASAPAWRQPAGWLRAAAARRSAARRCPRVRDRLALRR